VGRPTTIEKQFHSLLSAPAAAPSAPTAGLPQYRAERDKAPTTGSELPIPRRRMLSLDELRRLLDRPDLTDAQATKIRDLLSTLADMLIDDYLAERNPFSPDEL
jgi:hypothetical protein